MFNLKVRITKFGIQITHAIKRPRHIDLHFLLAFQRIRDVCTHAHQIAVGKVVRDIPVTIATELNAHVAKHMVEIKDRHVKRLRYLRGGQRVLSGFVQQSQSRADDLIRHCENFLRTGQGQLLVAFLFLQFEFLPAQHNLARASSLNFVAM